LRNETGSYRRGQHCAQYRVQRLSKKWTGDGSTPVNWPLNIAHNTLPQVFARMGLLPQGVVESLKDFVSGGRHPGSVGEKRTLPNPVLLAEKLSQCGLELRTNHVTVML
jgi:hypothetical protein